ncbi:helix-hairpin-helix domain-containing protein [Lentibacillus songyuanensis]|uniref:helix-hairpin-helix domain-containing protein n=1 Tax=Lentibacillus songyuanensis TaxID=3136161 RepID=UPI00386218EF
MEVADKLGIKEIFAQLPAYGITPNVTLKLYKKYGSENVRGTLQNPYRVTETDGVGFLTVDVIPENGNLTNIRSNSSLYQVCFELYLLGKKTLCFVTEDDLVKEILFCFKS